MKPDTTRNGMRITTNKGSELYDALLVAVFEGVGYVVSQEGLFYCEGPEPEGDASFVWELRAVHYAGRA